MITYVGLNIDEAENTSMFMLQIPPLFCNKSMQYLKDEKVESRRKTRWMDLNSIDCRLQIHDRILAFSKNE